MAASASTSTRTLALRGYRKLLRASHRLFANDRAALLGAGKELRSHFEQHRNETDVEAIRERLKDIEDVHEMMAVNLVQARLNERGNYEVTLPGQKMEGEEAGCAPKYEALHQDMDTSTMSGSKGKE